MANNRKTISIEYTAINQSFKKGIQENRNSVKTLNKEFQLQKEQMKNTATESQRLEMEVEKLSKEYQLAQERTKMTAKALDDVKEATGETSNQTRLMSDKLLDAKRNEEYLKNAIQDKTAKLKDAVATEKTMTEEQKKAIAASDKRKAKLNELENSQEQLKSSSEKLEKQYELEVSQLGNNARESDKAKLKQKLLADSMKVTAQQVDNLEEQLKLAKTEYGANSKEVDKLEHELLEAKKANQDFANSYNDSTNKLKNFGNGIGATGEKLKSVGRGMTTYVTAPLIAGVGLSVKAASDFDSAFTGVKKTVDEVTDKNGKVTYSYAKLESGIRNMAKEIPASTTEISNVAEAAGQLGIETPNVLGFTRTMIDMGQATNMSSEDASTALAKLANITQMPQKNFDRLGSSIVALGNNMATTERDIVEMSLRLAGSGKQANMSESQILGLAAAMSSVGINAEAGGGSMSRVMQKIQTDVLSGKGNLNKFAKVSGMTSKEFQKAWKTDASQAIVSFVKGLGEAKKSGKDVTGILKQMGITSTQEVDTMLRLSGAGDLLAKALDVSADGWKENKALSEEATKRYATFESKLKIVKNKLMDIGIELGGPFMDALSSALDALEPLFKVLTNLAKSFSQASPMMQKFIIGIIAIVAAAGPLLMIIGTIATAVSGIIGLISAVAGVLGVGTAAAAGIVAIVPIIIAAIIALVALIIVYWDEIKSKTIEIWNAISDFFVQLWSSITTIASEAWESFTNWLKEIFTKFIQVSIIIWTPIIEFFSNLWTTISDFFVSVWDSISAFLVATWNNIVLVAQTTFDAFVAFWQTIWNAIWFVLEPIVSLIAVFLEATWMLIVAGAQIAWEALKQFIITPIISAYDWVVLKLTQLATWLALQWEKIKIMTNAAWQMFKQYIITPIISAYDWVVLKLNALANWINVKWQAIKSAAYSAWSLFKQYIINPVISAYEYVHQKIESLRAWLSGVWNSIKSNVSTAWQAVKDYIVSPVEDAYNKVKSFVDKIGSAIGKIQDFFGSIKMPSFSLKTSSKTILGKEITYPSGIKVNWHRRGGIFKHATIAGLGEAGEEAALPLVGNAMNPFADAVAHRMLSQSPQEVDSGTSIGNIDILIQGNYVRSDKDLEGIANKVVNKITNTDNGKRRSFA